MSSWLSGAALLGAAVAVCGIGIGLGILLGRRLDRALEDQASQAAAAQDGKEAQ